MLNINDLNVYYGNIHVIKGINFYVDKGEIVSLIGANGAGKTTILHTLSGIVKKRTGKINFLGNDIIKMTADKIVRAGLIQVPEGRRIFSNLTVKENLEMGSYTVVDKSKIKQNFTLVYEKFPRLKERKVQQAGTLSGGEQQMLAIGRALMSMPKFLLLDEPSMGLAPYLVKEIFEIIKEINKIGTTILLVEQNANMALSISNRAYVLETGKIVLEGNAKDLANSEEVKNAYLGISKK